MTEPQEVQRREVYQGLVDGGMSDAEARGTAWPEVGADLAKQIAGKGIRVSAPENDLAILEPVGEPVKRSRKSQFKISCDSLTLTGGKTIVEIDGHDISASVSGVSLVMRNGHLNRIVLEMIPQAVEVSGQAIVVEATDDQPVDRTGDGPDPFEVDSRRGHRPAFLDQLVGKGS